MNCLHCSKSSILIVATDHIKCDYCKKETLIYCYMCESCGTTWQVKNNQVVPGSMVIIDKYNWQLFDLDFSDSLLFNRCIICNSIVCEKAPNLYCCMKCGFEWEINSGLL